MRGHRDVEFPEDLRRLGQAAAAEGRRERGQRLLRGGVPAAAFHRDEVAVGQRALGGFARRCRQ
ncbi:hypothetical protein, partial [Dietzia sp.]|uniref:hypothetical protein n=1 Tax=Dietzia sp. TaxID=1871616 RepID=UPI00272D59CF